MIGKMKKSVIALIVVGALAVVTTAAVVITGINSDQKSYKFFYPDNHYRKLKSETRSIRIKDKSGSSLEMKLLKEYVLGPAHYSLKLVIPDDIIVKNVWSVGGDTIYINFNEGFERYLRNNNRDCGWFLAGMVETLKENTRYKRAFILINDNSINESAGEYRLSLPLMIRGGTD